MEVVATCTSKEEAIQAVNELPVDVILMDIHLLNDSQGGIDAALNITYDCINTKIIMLSSFNDPNIIMEALSAGAKNYIVKKDYLDIPQLIRDVHHNMASLHHSVSETIRLQLVEMKRTEMKNKLSKDEVEYMLYLDRGLSYDEIADIKVMDPQSVKNKFYRMTKKLGWKIKSYKEMVDKAKKMHLF